MFLGALWKSLVVFVAAVAAFILGAIVMANIVGQPEQADMSGYNYLGGNLPLLMLALVGVFIASSLDAAAHAASQLAEDQPALVFGDIRSQRNTGDIVEDPTDRLPVVQEIRIEHEPAFDADHRHQIVFVEAFDGLTYGAKGPLAVVSPQPGVIDQDEDVRSSWRSRKLLFCGAES